MSHRLFLLLSETLDALLSEDWGPPRRRAPSHWNVSASLLVDKTQSTPRDRSGQYDLSRSLLGGF